MSGTSGGLVTNFDGKAWSQQSFFDYLRVNNRTFGGYYQDDIWALHYFNDTRQPVNSKFIQELEPNFYQAAKEGKLAQFVWLQPRMTTKNATSPPTWQHPDASVLEGERLIKQVYEALRASPSWNDTLFLITYDEHGGFFDHVTPPSKGVPNPDGLKASNGFNFDRLGIRIPTIAVSPWIKKGTVVSKGLPGEMPTPSSQFDATSVIATTMKLLGIQSPPLTKRVAWANTFSGIFNELTSPRTDCPEVLPSLPPMDVTAFDVQRAKPLNDHMSIQLDFYCDMNYNSREECPGRRELVTDQGQASDFIVAESKKYISKLREKERMHDLNLHREVDAPSLAEA
jgi:phospholipase C